MQVRKAWLVLAVAAALLPVGGVGVAQEWDSVEVLRLDAPSPGVIVEATRGGLRIAPLGIEALHGVPGAAEHNNQYEAASCSDPYLIDYFNAEDQQFPTPPYNYEPGVGNPCAGAPPTNLGPNCNAGDPLLVGYTPHVHGIDGYRFWTVTAGPFGVGWAWACEYITGSKIMVNCVPQGGAAFVTNGWQWPSWQCAIMQKGPSPLWAYGQAGPWQGGGCNCQNAYASRTTIIFDS